MQIYPTKFARKLVTMWVATENGRASKQGQLELDSAGWDDKLEGVRENGASNFLRMELSHVDRIDSTDRHYFVERLAVRVRRSQRQ
jgi:hypothetical protein